MNRPSASPARNAATLCVLGAVATVWVLMVRMLDIRRVPVLLETLLVGAIVVVAVGVVIRIKGLARPFALGFAAGATVSFVDGVFWPKLIPTWVLMERTFGIDNFLLIDPSKLSLYLTVTRFLTTLVIAVISGLLACAIAFLVIIVKISLDDSPEPVRTSTE